MPCPFREKTATQWLNKLAQGPTGKKWFQTPGPHASKARSFSMLSNWGKKGGHEEEKKQIPVTNMSNRQEQGTLLPTLESSQLGS